MQNRKPVLENSFLNRAFANFKDSHIVVSGGMEPSGIRSKNVEVYEIRSDKWIVAPCLVTERDCHVSCSLGDYVYIAGGINCRESHKYIANTL